MERRTEFLTAKQLADLLQVSEATIHRLRRRGRIPAIVLTKRLIRFHLRDVKAALGCGHLRSTEEEEPSAEQLSFADLFAEFEIKKHFR
ncbi:MAG: helix-turn-helix domain-containing protein [Blastocatellia bacterium]|nr:helix-turn-helix domain-containing protein [Blastocatellia bacterium]